MIKSYCQQTIYYPSECTASRVTDRKDTLSYMGHVPSIPHLNMLLLSILLKWQMDLAKTYIQWYGQCSREYVWKCIVLKVWEALNTGSLPIMHYTSCSHYIIESTINVTEFHSIFHNISRKPLRWPDLKPNKALTCMSNCPP